MRRAHGLMSPVTRAGAERLDIERLLLVHRLAEEGAGRMRRALLPQHQRHQKPADAAIAVGHGMDVLEHPVRQRLADDFGRTRIARRA